MFTRARTLTLARAATADGNAGIPQRRWLHLHLQTPKPPHRREVLVEWNFRPDAILRRTGLDDCDLGTLFHPDDGFAELVVQYVAGVEDVGFCYFDTDGGIRQGGKQADVALTLGGPMKPRRIATPSGPCSNSFPKREFRCKSLFEDLCVAM